MAFLSGADAEDEKLLFFADICFGFDAVSSIQPCSSHLRHVMSKSAPECFDFQ